MKKRKRDEQVNVQRYYPGMLLPIQKFGSDDDARIRWDASDPKSCRHASTREERVGRARASARENRLGFASMKRETKEKGERDSREWRNTGNEEMGREHHTRITDRNSSEWRQC